MKQVGIIRVSRDFIGVPLWLKKETKKVYQFQLNKQTSIMKILRIWKIDSAMLTDLDTSMHIYSRNAYCNLHLGLPKEYAKEVLGRLERRKLFRPTITSFATKPYCDICKRRLKEDSPIKRIEERKYCSRCYRRRRILEML